MAICLESKSEDRLHFKKVNIFFNPGPCSFLVNADQNNCRFKQNERKVNLVPGAFHVHPLFGKKGKRDEVQVVKLLLLVEITKNSPSVSKNLTHQFIA